jgi:hypothetical protein
MTNLFSASESDWQWHPRKPHVEIDSHEKSQLSVDVDVRERQMVGNF